MLNLLITMYAMELPSKSKFWGFKMSNWEECWVIV